MSRDRRGVYNKLQTGRSIRVRCTTFDRLQRLSEALDVSMASIANEILNSAFDAMGVDNVEYDDAAKKHGRRYSTRRYDGGHYTF